MMMLIQRRMQSVHLHKKYQTFIGLSTNIIPKHSFNSMEISDKSLNNCAVVSKTNLQCKNIINEG
jgi:hypothetical protein